MDEEADICIICEGSYPYLSGGVAQWVHELITEHKERSFRVLTLMPVAPNLTFKYQFPQNVIGHTVYIVQDLPTGAPESQIPTETWSVIHPILSEMLTSRSFDNFAPLYDYFQKYRDILGRRILTESESSWDFFLELYHEISPNGPFRAYYGTALTIARSLYSIILPELPKAKIYHAVCTGYAGFLLHRAKQEKGASCILTEHGIYSNERRIEIAMANWIPETGALDLAIEDKKRTLKDFWLNTFLSLAHACYISCDQVTTTFDGNQVIQLEGGADPKKTRTIVHGIKEEKRQIIKRDQSRRPPAVAFIGRVVPIKDVKTFIRACKIIHEQMPEVRLYALGPTEEDPRYFAECQRLVDDLGLRDHLKFTGRVKLEEYLPEIDIVVLTSISEAQPLVILEAGATGVPIVATHVGACDQLIYGCENESPNLGQGGIVTPLVDSGATAEAVIRLLKDRDFYFQCSENIAKRITTHYRFEQEHGEYRKLYKHYLGKEASWQV